VVDIAESAKVFDTAQPGMFNPTPQPEAGVEVSPPDYSAGETDAGLNYESRFLRIGGRRTAAARRRQPVIPC
jgi:hypothetical protein